MRGPRQLRIQHVLSKWCHPQRAATVCHPAGRSPVGTCSPRARSWSPLRPSAPGLRAAPWLVSARYHSSVSLGNADPRGSDDRSPQISRSGWPRRTESFCYTPKAFCFCWNGLGTCLGCKEPSVAHGEIGVASVSICAHLRSPRQGAVPSNDPVSGARRRHGAVTTRGPAKTRHDSRSRHSLRSCGMTLL